jgi:acetyl esterase/lipase
MRAAGVEAVLNVFEGQSHAQYAADPSSPETKEYFDEVRTFFERHLGKSGAE